MSKLALTGAVLAVLGLVLYAAPSAERARERPSGRLVLGMIPPERVAVVDVRTGRSVSMRVPGGTLCHGPLLVTAGRLIFAGTAKGHPAATAIGLDLRRPARSLGRTHQFFPSATPGRLWLARVRYGRAVMSFSSLREVTVRGRTTSVARHGAPGVNVEGALEDGLLIERGGKLRVWDPRRGKVLRRMPGAYALGSHGRQVAWCRGRCRTLHVTGPAGEVAISSPASVDSRGAFSPDGSLLALPLGGTRIALVDLAARSLRAIPGARLSSYGALAWAPSGRWLFFAAPHRRLMAYRPGDRRPIALKWRPPGTVLELAAAG